MEIILKSQFRTKNDAVIPSLRSRRNLADWYGSLPPAYHSVNIVLNKYERITFYWSLVPIYFAIVEWPNDYIQHPACHTSTKSKYISMSWVLCPYYDLTLPPEHTRIKAYCVTHREHAMSAYLEDNVGVPPCREWTHVNDL